MAYTTHIKAKTRWLDINLKELYQYKDLIWLFFKRNYTTKYKQTILGPIWLVVSPIITVLLYAFVFGNLAGLSSGDVPQFVFYLSSNALWSFFASCLTQTASTFTANAGIMGKVYFPRLVMPISAVLTSALDLIIQMGLLVVTILGYVMMGFHFDIGVSIIIAPILVLQVGMLGLGFGIIIAALTTKYRDLAVLVGFGVQLWMYVTPVVYTINIIPNKYMNFYMINPMSSIMEGWRKATIGIGTFPWKYWGESWILTFGVLFVGVLLFNRIEKTFMDTV